MNTIQIEGVFYRRDDCGILIPENLFVREGGRIRKPEDSLLYLSAERVAAQEHFVVLTLDADHKLIKKHVVTIGLVNRSQVHPRETFRPAILDNAVGVILAHNHPSGSLEASVDDLIATRRLVDAGKIIGISVLDHLIVTAGGFISIRERFPDYLESKLP